MFSNQNYAVYGHIAYYWSPDWGDTWIGHPDNPIIAPGQFPDGVPAYGFQRTPTLVIDEAHGRYIIAYNAGHDITQKWKRRTYLATASRPATCCLWRVGDANGLGGDEPTIGDVSVMIDAKFITGTCDGILDCFTEADINQSGGAEADCDDITIGDISTLIDVRSAGLSVGPALGEDQGVVVSLASRFLVSVSTARSSSASAQIVRRVSYSAMARSF